MLYRSNGRHRTPPTTEGDPDGPRRRPRTLEPARARSRHARPRPRRRRPCPDAAVDAAVRGLDGDGAGPRRWRSSRPRRPAPSSSASLRRGLPRHREPRPAAGRRDDGVHDPAGGRRVPGRPRLRRRSTGRSRPGPSLAPDGGKGSSSSVHVDDATGPRLRHPGIAAAGRAGDHGRRPACRRDRGRGLLRDTRCHDLRRRDGGGADRPRRRHEGRRRTRSRRPSGRTTRTSIRRLVLVLGDQHDAEDIAQDAYLEAYPSWDRFDGVDVRAWLYTIAPAAGVQPPARPAALAGGDRPDRAAAVGRPDRPGPVGGARDARRRGRGPRCCSTSLDGYTQAEIARMLAVPEGTVASWISRGRAALRRELDPER